MPRQRDKKPVCWRVNAGFVLYYKRAGAGGKREDNGSFEIDGAAPPIPFWGRKGPVGRWKLRVDAKAMDELDYSRLPLSPGEREKLIQRYAGRFQRFRERSDQQPHDIEKCDYEELIIGPLRDLLSLLLDVESTPEQREQWLREHARRILKDPDAQRIAWEVAKKHLDGEGREKHEDYVTFLVRQVADWRNRQTYGRVKSPERRQFRESPHAQASRTESRFGD